MEDDVLINNISIKDAEKFMLQTWPRFQKDSAKWIASIKKLWDAVPDDADGADPKIIALEKKAEALEEKYRKWVVKTLKNRNLLEYMDDYEEVFETNWIKLRSDGYPHEEHEWNPRNKQWEMDYDDFVIENAPSGEPDF